MISDRTFAALTLALAIGYGVIAFGLKAPFQYDPLGPEGWPKLLAVVLAVCAVAVFVWPDPDPDWGDTGTLVRLALTVAALAIYALLFRELGFIVTTTLFCGLVAWRLGAAPLPSAVYGLGMGVVGYLLCTRVMGLNLPAGIIPL